MAYILILEDLASDLHHVESVLKQIGSYEVRSFPMASRAIESLSDALAENLELPQLIVVDLNLPASSGYELLRFYHATPRLKSIPCVVWSVMDTETDKKLTTWMGSRKLISKQSGPATLRKSLAELLKPGTQPEQDSSGERRPPQPA